MGALWLLLFKYQIYCPLSCCRNFKTYHLRQILWCACQYAFPIYTYVHSPKKSRRDGKQATERTYSSSHHRDVDTLERDQKRRRRLQDAQPLEIPPEMESKVQPETIKEGVDKKVDGLPDGRKHSSDHTEIPRSRSYFQVSFYLRHYNYIFQGFLCSLQA